MTICSWKIFVKKDMLGFVRNKTLNRNKEMYPKEN